MKLVTNYLLYHLPFNLMLFPFYHISYSKRILSRNVSQLRNVSVCRISCHVARRKAHIQQISRWVRRCFVCWRVVTLQRWIIAEFELFWAEEQCPSLVSLALYLLRLYSAFVSHAHQHRLNCIFNISPTVVQLRI